MEPRHISSFRFDAEDFLGRHQAPLASMEPADLDREAAVFDAASRRTRRWPKHGMIAVSNTTPLRYLIAIGRGDLPGQFVWKVFVPGAVYEELTDTLTTRAIPNTFPSHARAGDPSLSLRANW